MWGQHLYSKPHTPSSGKRWTAWASVQAKIDLPAPRSTRRLGLRLRWNDPRSRFTRVPGGGDRRVAAVVERAWRSGARFDAWQEHHDTAQWKPPAAEGLDMALHLSPTAHRRGFPLGAY